MEDISRRAINTLRSVDFILAEDTRHTRKLLSRHGIHGNLTSCHQFNEAARTQQVLDKVKSGSSIALVTNAGMPGISDPGSRLVAACREQGISVSVIPGPSSVTSAVALSGFGGARFLFEGFLPRKTAARERRLTQLRALPYPVVLFESPYRCLRLLAEMKESFAQRTILMARELTKINEECLWGTASEIYELLAQRGSQDSGRAVKGELVLVIAPASRAELRENAGDNT